MPIVNGKHFPYTPEGKVAAKMALKKMVRGSKKDAKGGPGYMKYKDGVGGHTYPDDMKYKDGAGGPGMKYDKDYMMKYKDGKGGPGMTYGASGVKKTNYGKGYMGKGGPGYMTGGKYDKNYMVRNKDAKGGPGYYSNLSKGFPFFPETGV